MPRPTPLPTPAPALLTVLWPALLCACSGKGGSGGDSEKEPSPDGHSDTAPAYTPDTVPLSGACPLADRLGGFQIESYAEYAIVTGAALDGVVPISVLEEVAAEGDCRLLRRANPACDPPCSSDQTCDLSGTCVPYPRAVSLGTVTAAGLLEPATMEPVPPTLQYFLSRIPNPPWTVNGLITLQSTGGDLLPFTLHGLGVAPLSAVTPAWVLRRDQPLALAWADDSPSDRTAVDLHLSIDQHGLTPLSLRCTFADDGAAEIPASLIGAMLAAGVTGFPNGYLIRHTTDSAALRPDGTGCLDLRVGFRHDGDVAVEGYVPCTGDDDCPDGLSCNESLERCE